MIESGARTFKDIQTEYDQLFQTEPIRDDDRGYFWHATQVLKAKPQIKKLLDVACGGGFFLRQVRDLTAGKAGLTGIDISGEAVELAKKECPEAQYLLGVGESLPLRNNTFDAITCLGSMEHFLDIQKAVDEMKRVAAPDARFFILVPNLFWYKDILWVLFTGRRKTRNQTHERFAALGEWKELLTDLGLEPVRTLKYNGIAKQSWKQRLKDILIPLRFSYHFFFICRAK